jgi:L-alanine-DL-glutamate epimerase-like enolase superfamily enzyme
MIVTDVKAFPSSWMFVKVETDERIHGWGEALRGEESVLGALT